LDLVARAYRIRWYARGLGAPLPLREAFRLNAWGDAAAGLTPLRLGGEPARLAGLLRAGVPAATAFLAIGLEVVVAYPVVFLFGGLLVWRYAPAWWAHAGPVLKAGLERGWPWAVAVLGTTILVWVLVARWKRVGIREPLRGAGRVRGAGWSAPVGPVLGGIVTSFVNVAARTAMLPLLALTVPEHPPVGVLFVGSFVLLYSQLVLPTPAGAGAVELGFLAGVAGDLGPGEAGLLLAWRFYTVGAGALLGVALAAHIFGTAPLLDALRRVVRRPAA
jgi:uncharacterized membrane protein YbhN (UPF0104 family)